MGEFKTKLIDTIEHQRANMRILGGMRPPLRPMKLSKLLWFSHYTSLTTQQSRILEEELNADLIPPYKRRPTSPNADQSRHYRYHRNFDHTTEECVSLKDKIEELIQAGHLRQFVNKREGKHAR